MAPELVLVPLTAGVREFNCLFHSCSAQGPTAKRELERGGQKTEVNKAKKNHVGRATNHVEPTCTSAPGKP